MAFDHQPQGPRWTTQTIGDRFLFGDLLSEYLSATFRQQLVILPRLVGQAYAQLFTANGRYGRFFEGSSTDRRPIALGDLAPSDATASGFHRAGLRLNLVLRWEYRLGSTLAAVYNRASENVLASDAPPPATLAPMGLASGRTTDSFLVKWSYFWHL
jgi:hypothetical protein